MTTVLKEEVGPELSISVLTMKNVMCYLQKSEICLSPDEEKQVTLQQPQLSCLFIY